jgi:hypothetical protein
LEPEIVADGETFPFAFDRYSVTEFAALLAAYRFWWFPG